MPISGREFVDDGGGSFCLDEFEYVGCGIEQGCGDFPTVGCDPCTDTAYQFLDTCLPDGWSECPDPGSVGFC